MHLQPTHTPPQPLLAQRSFSTPSYRQTHPSPPSSHNHPFWWSNSPLPHPPVILNPSWWSNSPLPSQQSSSIPSGSQIHLSLPDGHPPPLLATTGVFPTKLKTSRTIQILKQGTSPVVTTTDQYHNIPGPSQGI